MVLKVAFNFTWEILYRSFVPILSIDLKIILLKWEFPTDPEPEVFVKIQIYFLLSEKYLNEWGEF